MSPEFLKYKKYLEKSLIKDEIPYIITINPRQIHNSLIDSDPPIIVQSLFGIGKQFVTVDVDSMDIVKQGYKTEIEKQEQSGASVATDIFLIEKFSEISAVMYSCTPRDHIPEQLLEQISFAHNSKASNPLPMGWLPKVSEIWFDGTGVRREIVNNIK
jgi:type I restriction enzyme S subunit